MINFTDFANYEMAVLSSVVIDSVLFEMSLRYYLDLQFGQHRQYWFHMRPHVIFKKLTTHSKTVIKFFAEGS